MKSVTIQSLKEKLDSIDIIDIREVEEFNALPKLKQAKHIPMNQKPESYLNKQECYYLICRSGARTANVTQYLDSLGYNVINVTGGMLEYYNERKA